MSKDIRIKKGFNDLREELGKQLAHLKRQATQAERYKEYKEEERRLDARMRHGA